MPYCQKCGNELLEAAVYCTQCGVSVFATDEIIYRRSPKMSWDLARVLVLIFGALLLVTSFGLLVGGGGIMWVNDRFRDADNFLMSHEADFQVNSYALVQKSIDIDADVSLPSNLWIPEPGDWVKLKAEV